MASEVSGAKPPFEGFSSPRTEGAAPVIQWSFVVAPGSYDMVAAVRNANTEQNQWRAAVVVQRAGPDGERPDDEQHHPGGAG
jgi:hypothetical protein